nr:acyl-CoA dehydrogenase family protein [Bacillus thuringiensis]
MHFKLSEEHEMIRKMVRDFAKNEVAPTQLSVMRKRDLIESYLIKWQSLV